MTSRTKCQCPFFLAEQAGDIGGPYVPAALGADVDTAATSKQETGRDGPYQIRCKNGDQCNAVHNPLIIR